MCCDLCGHHNKIALGTSKSNPKEIIPVNNIKQSQQKNTDISTKDKTAKIGNQKNTAELKKNVSSSTKLQSQNLKNKHLKKAQPPSKKPSPISTTKQNNQLLKLAEMLKKSNNPSSNNSLNKLLK